MEIIEPLDWDSKFFNLKVGKALFSHREDYKDKFAEEMKRERYDLVYGESKTNQTPKGFWESLGFNYSDSYITMLKKFDRTEYDNIALARVNNLSKSDLEACYEVSEMTASVSRFYNDPAVGPQLTKKMYRKWIDTAVDGSFSDCLFVERRSGIIAGVHTVRTEKDTGVFTLTGVRKEFMNQGIGKALWNQSFGYWAKMKPGIKQVRSKFSIGNIPSFHFHLARGFNGVEQVIHVFHYTKVKNKS